MTYRGTVKNGVVVLDDPSALPEGTQVSVRPAQSGSHKDDDRGGPATMYERYERFIGKARGLPADFSTNHDHYLYGTPKRK
jgi:hypothetical protein